MSLGYLREMAFLSEKVQLKIDIYGGHVQFRGIKPLQPGSGGGVEETG